MPHYCYEIIRLRVYVMLWQTYQRKDMTSPSVAKSPRTFCSASSSRARGVAKESVTLFVQSAPELAWRLATAEPPAPTPAPARAPPAPANPRTHANARHRRRRCLRRRMQQKCTSISREITVRAAVLLFTQRVITASYPNHITSAAAFNPA